MFFECGNERKVWESCTSYAIIRIICRMCDVPIWFDISDSSDVVFGGEYEFVIEHPFWFVVQAGGWVQLDDLTVLHR